jgi:hypothetical protein
MNISENLTSPVVRPTVLRENKRPPEGGLYNRGLARRQQQSYERITPIPRSVLHYS